MAHMTGTGKTSVFEPPACGICVQPPPLGNRGEVSDKWGSVSHCEVLSVGKTECQVVELRQKATEVSNVNPAGFRILGK